MLREGPNRWYVSAVFSDHSRIVLAGFRQQWEANRLLHNLEGRNLYPGLKYTLSVSYERMVLEDVEHKRSSR